MYAETRASEDALAAGSSEFNLVRFDVAVDDAVGPGRVALSIVSLNKQG